MGSEANKPTPPQHARERVLTDDLARVIEEWRARYEAERPLSAASERWQGGKGGNSYSFMSAISYICYHAGVNDRQVSRILARETQTTSFWLADQILSAIGLTHYLYNDTIRQAEMPRGNQNGKHNGKQPPAKIPEHMGTVEAWRLWNRFGMSNEQWAEYLDSIGCRR